jgi:hypothetical protein
MATHSQVAIFVFVATSEPKTGFLSIEVFSKLFNTKSYAPQGSIPGGLLIYLLTYLTKLVIYKQQSMILHVPS